MKNKKRIAFGAHILVTCLEYSIALLKYNSGPFGINAASRSKKAEGRNYVSIFGRDGAICALGLVVSGDTGLIRFARKSLLNLAIYQAPNGQIPKFEKPEKDEVDFSYTGGIDATLWWLIAVDFYEQYVPEDLTRPLKTDPEFEKDSG